MALAPKLQVKQGQSLVMTPQLQQAIKLLQLSNIELAAFVEEQLESNPLLERGTGDENRREDRGQLEHWVRLLTTRGERVYRSDGA